MPSYNGLSNPKNYCFANALFQCVRHVHGFCERLDSTLNADDCSESGPAFGSVFAIGTLMRQLNGGCDFNGSSYSRASCSSTIVSTDCYRELAQRTELLSVNPSQQDQNDPHEFFELFLLEELAQLSSLRRERELGREVLRCKEEALSMAEEKVAQELLQRSFRPDDIQYKTLVGKHGKIVWDKHGLRASENSIAKLFTGQVVRGSLCSKCQALSTTVETSTVVALGVSCGGSGGGDGGSGHGMEVEHWGGSAAGNGENERTTLQECFERMIACENQGVGHQLEQKICHSKTCGGQRRDAQTQTMFLKLPPCLVVCLKRYARNPTSGQLYKLQTQVAVPLEGLEMAKYHFEHCPEEASKYDLTAVCAHLGDSLHSGHYIAYCRELLHDRKVWRRYDDGAVTEVDRSAVASAARTNGYMLFYTRQGPT
jgi:ubiquitin C-terminal hydrolase